VVIFLASVCAVMRHRHFFDDETINVSLLRQKTLGQLYHFAQSQDVHPPLHYLVNKLVFEITGSLDAILYVNALLLAAALFFFVRSSAEKTESLVARVALAVGMGLNPSLLLWGVSLRWYSYWIPLSLALFWVLFLVPRTKSSLPKAAVLAVVSFYFGYLTLVYVGVLILVESFTRGIRISRRLALAAGLSILAILPQCYYLVTVHLPQGKGQSSHNPLKLFGSAGIGAFVGPLVFPVSPIAIGFAIAIVVASLWILGKSLLGRGTGSLIDTARRWDPAIMTVILLFLAEIVSGIAIKERNLAMANILLFAWIAVNIETLPTVARVLFLAVCAMFLAMGLDHLVRQSQTGKASVNTPIGSLRQLIQADEARNHTDDSRSWMVTWDDVASCYGLLWGMHVAGPFSLGVEHEAETFDDDIPKGTFIVVLRTQQGIWTGRGWQSAKEFYADCLRGITNPRRASLGYDRYHGFESKMTGSLFPPYQIEYLSGVSNRVIHLHWVSDPLSNRG
jgi:hypothetical protein